MTHVVVITERAQQEAQAAHDWWAQHRSAQQAARWYDEFIKVAFSLDRNLERYTFAPENDRFPYEVRQLNFGIGRKPTHRLVYTIAPTKLSSYEFAILPSERLKPTNRAVSSPQVSSSSRTWCGLKRDGSASALNEPPTTSQSSARRSSGATADLSRRADYS
jgi:hypothetical protein